MSLGDVLQRRRVAASWLYGAAYFALADPAPRWIAAGFLVMAAGAAVRAWASGHIRKQETLAVTGPYARTRNPLYLGSLVMAAGALVMARSWAAALLFAATAVPLYLAVMRREERFLEERFGEVFREYRDAVPLLIPRLRPRGSGRSGGFDRGLLRRHREWKVWAGAALVTVLLGAKYYWL